MRRLLLACVAAVGLACERAPAPAPELPNVLLLVLDTTRADALSALGGPEGATPTLDRLAREGVLFTEARATSAWTVPTHGSLFTGLYPSRHGAHHESAGLPEDRTTLAEVLQATHQTAGFTENPHIVWDKGFSQGFEHYDETWRERESWEGPPHTLDALELWLGKRDRARPFFVFVNLMTPHLPYTPPLEYQERFVPTGTARSEIERFRELDTVHAERFMTGALRLTEGELGVIRALYQAEVAFVDARVERLVATLERDGSLDRTLLIVVGDHGENIGDHGLMEHQLCLYESLLRVPLIVRLPGAFEGGARRGGPVQLTDVMPSVLDVLGLPREQWPRMQGESLVAGDPPAERAVIAEYMRPVRQRRHFARADPTFDFAPFDRRLKSIQVGPWKLIASDRGETELYHVAEDPDELRDLSGSHPEERDRLEARLRRFAPTFDPAESGEPTIDEETERALRELGYVE
jgi:arylsulfatase A-like enzyme